MAAIGNASNITVKISADNSDATQKLKETSAAVTAVETSSKGGASALADFSGAATIATTAIAAAGTAIAATSAAIFLMTKNWAAYGTVIANASQQTGVASQSLFALKYAAESAGLSFEDVTSAVGGFNALLGDAAIGNEKASDTLKTFGVTSKDATIALTQAIQVINAEADATKRAVAAKELFGDETGKVQALVRSFDGDLPALIAKLQKLGITFSDEGAARAKEFTSQFKILEQQSSSLAREFSTGLMPAVTLTMNELSQAMAGNQSTAQVWGQVVGDALRGTVIAATSVRSGLGDFFLWLGNAFADSASEAEENASRIENALWAVAVGAAGLAVYNAGATERQERERQNNNVTRVTGDAGTFVNANRSRIASAPSGGAGRGGRGSRPKADDSASRELAAQIDLQKLNLSELENAYKQAMSVAREEFKKTGDAIAFITGANSANSTAAQGLPAILDALDALEQQALKDPTSGQKTLLGRQQAARRAAIQALGIEDVKKNNEEIIEADRKMAEAILDIFENLAKAQQDIEEQRLELWRDSVIEGYVAQMKAGGEDALQAQIDLNAFLYEQAEFDKNAKIDLLKDELAARRQVIQDTVKDEDSKFKLLAALDELYKQKALLAEDEFQRQKKEIEKKYGTISADGSGDDPKKKTLFGLSGSMGEVMKGLGDMGKDSIAGFANGVGSIVEQFVLLGTAGPNAMRKLTASVLAGLAAQAAVKSLFYLAEGIASLFWNPGAAVGYFKASAIMAGIALGAGGAGRAIAGNSFSDATGGSSGSGGGASDATSRAGLVFTNPFRGFENIDQKIAAGIEMAMTPVTEAVTMFNEKFGIASAGDVVRAGIPGNEAGLGGAVIEGLTSGQIRSDDLHRASGLYGAI